MRVCAVCACAEYIVSIQGTPSVVMLHIARNRAVGHAQRGWEYERLKYNLSRLAIYLATPAVRLRFRFELQSATQVALHCTCS